MNRIPVIGREAKFYGYIIGVSLEPRNDEDGRNRMFATFEYGGESKEYRVPDIILFRKLITHLVFMQQERNCGHPYGNEKLWIEKVGRKWVVDLP